MATTILAGASSTVTIPQNYRLDLTGNCTVTYGPGPLYNQTQVCNNTGSFGPYNSDQVVYISAIGSVGYDLIYTVNNPALIPINTTAPAVTQADQSLSSIGAKLPNGARFAYAQIPVATFGDSIANISSLANFDLRQISGTTFGQTSERMGVALNAYSGGAIRIVSNCGIGGESTTAMLARDAAGASATRKALTDAQSTGAKYVVFSAGINDIQNPALPGGSTSAVIDTTVAASIANLKALCKRAIAFGMVPVVPALLGYRYEPTSGLATNNATNVATTQEAIRRWNAAAKQMFADAGGLLGYWVGSFYTAIVDSNGAWLPGLDQGDGQHPSFNGCNLIYGEVVKMIQWLDGNTGRSTIIYPAGLANLFANSDFSASTSGTATGLNIYAAVGTITQVKSIVDINGQNWQEVLCTPTVLDGNGNAGIEIDATYTASGVSAADVLGGELSIYIDDGNGSPAANVFQHCVRIRSNTTYADSPLFNPTISPKVGLKDVVNRRVSSLPIVAPATPSTNPLLSFIVFANSLTPFRVRISRPRVVKLPTTY